MRNNKTFDGKVNRRSPPPRKSVQQILSLLENGGRRMLGTQEKYGGKKRKRHLKKINWTKKCIFWELHYWSSLSLHHNLDVIHIEKNVCDSLLGTILNIDKKVRIQIR